MSDLMIRRRTRDVPTLESGRIKFIRKRVLPCCSLQTAVLDDLRRLGVRPKRSLGQNFLVSESVLSDIVEVACIRAGDHVVEIGMAQLPDCRPTPCFPSYCIARSCEKTVHATKDFDQCS